MENDSEARSLYQRALASDSNLIDAASNLGVIEAQSGNLSAAITWLTRAFERAPGGSSIGMNLARAYCLSGRFDAARASTARVLEFNPDFSAAKKLQAALAQAKPSCGN